MKSVLVIDGFSFVRNSIRDLINANDEMCAFVLSNDLTQCSFKNKTFTVVILDVSVPSTNSLESLVDIKMFLPDTPIFIVNGSSEQMYAKNYINIGCKGYLSSNCNHEMIIHGINALSEGKSYIKPDELNIAIQKQSVCEKFHTKLTLRELQVFIKLSTGKSLSTIADNLNISNKTVSGFKRKIFKKMNFKNNADIIKYALKHHFLMHFDDYQIVNDR